MVAATEAEVDGDPVEVEDTEAAVDLAVVDLAAVGDLEAEDTAVDMEEAAVRIFSSHT